MQRLLLHISTTPPAYTGEFVPFITLSSCLLHAQRMKESFSVILSESTTSHFARRIHFCHYSTVIVFSSAHFFKLLMDFISFPCTPQCVNTITHHIAHSMCMSSFLPFSTFNIYTHTIFNSCWCSWILTKGFLHSKIQCHKEIPALAHIWESIAAPVLCQEEYVWLWNGILHISLVRTLHWKGCSVVRIWTDISALHRFNVRAQCNLLEILLKLWI